MVVAAEGDEDVGGGGVRVLRGPGDLTDVLQSRVVRTVVCSQDTAGSHQTVRLNLSILFDKKLTHYHENYI